MKIEDTYWDERKSNLKIEKYKNYCKFLLEIDIVNLKKKTFRNLDIICSAPKIYES
jgi:hypothetical protein